MIKDVETRLGKNQTGISMSPVDAKKMVEGAEELTPNEPELALSLGANRVEYMKEADPLGSLPIPPTVRGMAIGLKEAIKQGNHTFVDKLGERLAFERTGTRLYESLLSKHAGSVETEGLPPLDLLQRFRDEECKHFLMLAETIRELGADPTALTPGADNVGVASLGLVQVLSDPRTSFAQALEAILIAELADNDSWELLIQLAENAGAKEAASRFRQALEEEAFHLMKVREWVQALALGRSAPLQKTPRREDELRQHLG